MNNFFNIYKSKIETVVWCYHVNMLTNNRYVSLLNDKKLFKTNFPEASSSNPKIIHYIDERPAFTTTANEIRNEFNFNLLKAWTIVGSIISICSIFEYSLYDFCKTNYSYTGSSLGIFDRFKKITNINIHNFSNYDELKIH